MNKCGYEFVIMMKGMKELVKSLVFEVKGTFEESRAYSIRDYKVSGITVKHQLYPSDERKRYFHIYYNDRKKSYESEAVEAIFNWFECARELYDVIDEKNHLCDHFAIIISEKMTAEEALIIRNKFHRYLKERMVSTEKTYNYMTVPVAIRNLEKIKMLR